MSWRPVGDGDIKADALRRTLTAVAEAKPYLIDADPAVPFARDVGLGSAGGDPSTRFERCSVADFDKEFFGANP